MQVSPKKIQYSKHSSQVVNLNLRFSGYLTNFFVFETPRKDRKWRLKIKQFIFQTYLYNAAKENEMGDIRTRQTILHWKTGFLRIRMLWDFWWVIAPKYQIMSIKMVLILTYTMARFTKDSLWFVNWGQKWWVQTRTILF